MNKITLTIALIFGFTIANAQDTTCTYFEGLRVLEFDYYQDTTLYETKQVTKYYNIHVGDGDVLCLHLSDKKRRCRTVIITYPDGDVYKEVLDSKDDVYYSPKGTHIVSVGKAKLKL
jgi:hypothetical protein